MIDLGPSSLSGEELVECHNGTKKDGTSSNTPPKVCIKEKTRHKQDKDNEYTRVSNIGLLKS